MRAAIFHEPLLATALSACRPCWPPSAGCRTDPCVEPSRTIGVRGGRAPARVYIPELMGDVLEGRIEPGLVLDYETDLESVREAYDAMD